LLKILNTLIIFIKNPELGKVKTRLAATVGDEKALSIYKQLLQFTQNLSLSLELNRVLFYSDELIVEDDWSNNFFKKNVQNGNDLGMRMKNAFQKTFLTSKKAVIIGSDCAELTSEILQSAFDSLEKYDFVIGPAADGGYYLIGMNYFEPSIFENIEWSTNSVLTKTLEKINSLNKNTFLLPTLRDTDNEEDWKKIKHLLV
jgi:uncharacterized protein